MFWGIDVVFHSVIIIYIHCLKIENPMGLTKPIGSIKKMN